MSNSYRYIDPDYTYTDPKTGILRNLQEIAEPDVLLFVESGLVLNLNPPDSKNVYERYMKGTIEGDVQTLTELIFELIQTEK